MPDGSQFSLVPGAPSNPDYVSQYQAQPAAWLYDLDPANGVSRASYLGEVFQGDPSNANNRLATKGDIAAATTGVSSFNTRTGAVVLTTADVTGAGGAPIASPAFSGTPAAPTAAAGNNSGQIATTFYVDRAVSTLQLNNVNSFNGRVGAVTLTLSDITTAGGAATASPTFTGTPMAPTATSGTATGQIATTQFVSNAIAGGAVVSWNGRQGNVNLTLSDVQSVGGAPIAAPAFTGVATAATAAPGTATTQIATTAFVTSAITGATTGVSSFNTRTGAVVLSTADVTTAGGAPIVSPAFTGTPTAPTPTGGDSSTKLATTAFVGAAIAAGVPGVSTFNGRSGAVTFQLTDATSVGAAPIASPTFTGSPLAPTATVSDNSTKLATTAFVIGQAATTTPTMNGTAAVGTGTTFARADHVHPSDTSRAPIASPTFTGTVTIPAGASIAGYATTAQLGGYLPLSGGTINGALTVYPPASGDPLSVSANAGYPARCLYTIAGVREWSCGVLPGTQNGCFAIADESGATQVLLLTFGSNGGVISGTGRMISQNSNSNPSVATWDVNSGTGACIWTETPAAYGGYGYCTSQGIPNYESGKWDGAGNHWTGGQSYWPAYGNGYGYADRFDGTSLYIYVGSNPYPVWSSSDHSVKRNIRPSEADALAQLRRIPLHSYEMDEQPGKTKQTIHYRCGVIAQHIGEVFEEGMFMPPDDPVDPSEVGMTEDGEPLPHDRGKESPRLASIRWQAVHGYMIRAIQQLADRNDALASQLAAVQAQLAGARAGAAAAREA